MASVKEDELTLQLPASMIGKSSGISIDMGGSVLKVVYIDQAEWGEIESKKAENVTLRFRSFPRTDLERAVSFVKTLHVRRQTSDEVPVVFTTGVGLQNVASRIEKELNVKVENVIETNCFIKAAIYCVKNVPEKILSVPFSERATERGLSRGRNVLSHYQKTASKLAKIPATMKMIKPRINAEAIESVASSLEAAGTSDLSDEPIGKQEGSFPFLLGMLGSAFALIKVWEDGTYRMLTTNQLGGRTFLSLGSLLTGAKSYEDLIELAKKGDHRELDIYLKDMIKDDGKEDVYSSASSMDLFIYAFGKALGKDVSDFQKEDLARALLHLMAHNEMLRIINTILSDGCGHYIAAGNFPTSDLTKDIMVEEFLNLLGTRGAWYDKNEAPPARLHIPKVGGYFGALGAFLHGCTTEE